MNFTVYWRPAAESQLRRIWRNAANVEAVADAADAVNRILRDAAHEQGESRDRPTLRVWFHPPLCLHFEIDAAAKIVFVTRVKWVGG